MARNGLTYLFCLYAALACGGGGREPDGPGDAAVPRRDTALEPHEMAAGEVRLSVQPVRAQATSRDSLEVRLRVTNGGDSLVVFRDHLPLFAFRLLGPDGQPLVPVEDAIALSPPTTVPLRPGESLEHVVNLACVGPSFRLSYPSPDANCHLRYELARPGTYRLLVTYRAPGPPHSPDSAEVLELRGETAVRLAPARR